MNPAIGMPVRVVHVADERMTANGHHDHVQAGVVTQVWSPTCVNVKVLADCGEVFDVTSVPFIGTAGNELSGETYACAPVAQD